MKNIKVQINGKEFVCEEGKTILQVAIDNDIYIPTLCYLKGINNNSSCRICVVEIEGKKDLVTSCSTLVSDGMKIYTDNNRVRNNRKMTLELILSKHNKDCINCNKNMKCELQKLCIEYDLEGEKRPSDIDDSSPSIIRDNSKCILCGRCVAVCGDVQNCNAIGVNNRGYKAKVGCAYDLPIYSVKCVGCGQCTRVCPTGALQEKDDVYKVEKLLQSGKTVVVATAPSVRVALGEEFGKDFGTNCEGKMVSALRKLGFDKVFDINFTADLTIMEEAYEFIDRLTHGGALPMFTSCSPAWINYVEQKYPEFIPNLSTCKSPQGMFGAVLKTYFAKKNNLRPEDIVFVSIMPCTAKKDEITRDINATSKDIDVVLTTKELARLIKSHGIDFNSLKDAKFDSPLGFGSGAGAIFGVTGGVMEAALRTAYETITHKTLGNVDFVSVRGQAGIKEADVDIDGTVVKVAVVSGLGNASKLLEDIKAGKKKYHFVEIMSCPGGCINGGGQPYVSSQVLNKTDIKSLRSKAIYDIDKNMTIRKSHDNPYIQQIYKEYLGKPNSELAHKLLHTHYSKQNKI